ncbi:hypothetical protein ACTZGB_01550 [Yersinia bercovieri]|uniref:Uncharacterized protein n=1 Tax=Yersinia bercovieri ATCC 43970 TaxID=349968 RepID=A0ABM9XVI2_YERBE|nr:hypothetical protein yberc0001_25530 [Yersinia bercovieri ATCC 43970]
MPRQYQLLLVSGAIWPLYPVNIAAIALCSMDIIIMITAQINSR